MARPEAVQLFINYTAAEQNPPLETIPEAFKYITKLGQTSGVREEQHLEALATYRRFLFEGGGFSGDEKDLARVANLILDLEANAIDAPVTARPADGMMLGGASKFDPKAIPLTGSPQAPQAMPLQSRTQEDDDSIAVLSQGGDIPDPWANSKLAASSPAASVFGNSSALVDPASKGRRVIASSTKPAASGVVYDATQQMSGTITPPPVVPSGPVYLYEITIDHGESKVTDRVAAANRASALGKSKKLAALEDSEGSSITVGVNCLGEVTF